MKTERESGDLTPIQTQLAYFNAALNATRLVELITNGDKNHIKTIQSFISNISNLEPAPVLYTRFGNEIITFTHNGFVIQSSTFGTPVIGGRFNISNASWRLDEQAQTEAIGQVEMRLIPQIPNEEYFGEGDPTLVDLVIFNSKQTYENYSAQELIRLIYNGSTYTKYTLEGGMKSKPIGIRAQKASREIYFEQYDVNRVSDSLSKYYAWNIICSVPDSLVMLGRIPISDDHIIDKLKENSENPFIL
jgi:hypothetical protein